MKKEKICTILVVALLLLVMQGCSPKIKSVNDGIQQQLSAAKQANWKKSLSLQNAVLDIQNDNTEALILKALCLENLGQAGNALNTAEKASKVQNHFMAQYTYGRMLLKRGLYDDSVAPLTKACELNENDINALVLLCQATGRCRTGQALGNYGKLAKIYKENSDNKNLAVAWNEVAILYWFRNRLDNAAKCFSNALECDSNNPVIIRNCAIFLDYNPDASSYVKFNSNYTTAKELYQMYLDRTVTRKEFSAEREQIEKRMKNI